MTSTNPEDVAPTTTPKPPRASKKTTEPVKTEVEPVAPVDGEAVVNAEVAVPTSADSNDSGPSPTTEQSVTLLDAEDEQKGEEKPAPIEDVGQAPVDPQGTDTQPDLSPTTENEKTEIKTSAVEPVAPVSGEADQESQAATETVSIADPLSLTIMNNGASYYEMAMKKQILPGESTITFTSIRQKRTVLSNLAQINALHGGRRFTYAKE